jgi:hypothetical protein
MNNTTRKYPRSMQEAFPESVEAVEQRQRWEWMEGSKSDRQAQADFWLYVVMSFAAGFVTCLLTTTK